MALDRNGARQMLKDLRDLRDAELGHHELLWAYREGRQPHPIPENGLPPEVVRFLRLSRVNLTKLVVNVLAQSLFVDGFREDTPDTDTDAPAWEAWEANRFQSRQGAVHRGTFTYGTSYVIVEPADPVPVLTGRSPRSLTAIYGQDPDWPLAALEVVPNGKGPNGDDLHHFIVYDEVNRFTFTDEKLEDGGPAYVTEDPHGGEGVVPIVRFVNVEDLDDEIVGEVEDLIPIQDQIDVTTFELEVAKHYQAFRQRYVIGWLAESEREKAKASASRLWTFDDPDVKVGEFGQVDLTGYLKTREATVQYLAIASQTPPQHLIGELVNLSAEALIAAESGHRRKVNERTTTLGESWEQVFALINRYQGRATDVGAEVRWRDTEARSFAATIDALGKLAQMLNVPAEVLWEMVPHITQSELKRWKAAAAQGDSLGQLVEILGRQSADFPTG